MPTFMDSLANNPGGGIYNPQGNQPPVDPLSLVNQLKNRDLKDFKEKASFMSDLSLKQDRLKRIYDSQNSVNQGPNVQMAQDPNQLTGYQKGELGVKQQQNSIESQRLVQQGKLGEQALSVKTAQEQLNQQKSDQINQLKQQELQANIDKEKNNVQIANNKLKQSGDDFNAKLAAMQEVQAATERYHKAEMDAKQTTFEMNNQKMKDANEALQQKLDMQRNTQQTIETNPDGTKKTITTKRGTPGQTVTGTGKDGKQYQVPISQIDDWNANHAKSGTEISAPDNTQDEVLSGGQ